MPEPSNEEMATCQPLVGSDKRCPIADQPNLCAVRREYNKTVSSSDLNQQRFVIKRNRWGGCKVIDLEEKSKGRKKK